MAATNHLRTGNWADRVGRPGRAPRRRAAAPRTGHTGRVFDRDDAAALWRGLCTAGAAFFQRLFQSVAKLLRDAGAGWDRLRERAAVPPSLRAQPGDDQGSAPKKRGATAKGPQRRATSTTRRKTATKSTKKKPAATKRTAKRASGAAGSRNGSRSKAASSRSTAQTSRRAAKSRRATTGGKKRAGRKK